MLIESLFTSWYQTLSGLNAFICVYIICGWRRTIKHLSNHISWPEGYDRLSYLPVKVCICILPCSLFTQRWCIINALHYTIAYWARMEGVIIILRALYCKVFSPVNETWGNQTAFLSTLHQHRLSSCHWLTSAARSCVLKEAWLWRVFAGRVRSYVLKAIVLLLASPKSPTLPFR